MKMKTWIVTTLCLALAIATIPMIVPRGITLTFARQQTTINLSLADLRQACMLTIKATNPATRLTGQIKLDGRLIQTLSDRPSEINLSSYLKPGKHQIEILGSYTPAHASITVELRGTGTQVTQQTGGSGQLNQLLMINVN